MDRHSPGREGESQLRNRDSDKEAVPTGMKAELKNPAALADISKKSLKSE